MRAVLYRRFGPPEVLEVADIPEPDAKAGELKVKVFAAGLNPVDWKIRAGHVRALPMFARPPRVTGIDFAGEIVAVGGGAGPRHMGERVFGSLPPYGRAGSCAEYLSIHATYVVPIPAGVSFEAAAAVPIAGGAALQALADEAQLRAGQRVLITGAAGGVGHFAVQIAKQRGAYVVATSSADNTEFVRALGADEAIDYAHEDVTARADAFEVIFDAADVLGFRRVSAILARGGLYLSPAGSAATVMSTLAAGVIAPILSGKRARPFVLKAHHRMWQRLAELLASGALNPHISHRIGLEDVAAAQARMQAGHGRGKTVVLPHGPVL
jgi:NADPH:quinone reductase-like Zn-dependent oxidoreductase